MNLVFIIWTAFAFRRTLRYLHRKDDKLKYGIMLKLAIIFIVFVAISSALVLIETILRAGDPQMDSMWRSTWFWDKYGLIMQTFFIIGYMYILQPSDECKDFSNFAELLDETLNAVEEEQLEDDNPG